MKTVTVKRVRDLCEDRPDCRIPRSAEDGVRVLVEGSDGVEHRTPLDPLWDSEVRRLQGVITAMQAELNDRMAGNQRLVAERDEARAEVERLKGAQAYVDFDQIVALQQRAERAEKAVKNALSLFAAMPEASPHDRKDGIWHLWTDGCNILRAALDAEKEDVK